MHIYGLKNIFIQTARAISEVFIVEISGEPQNDILEECTRCISEAYQEMSGIHRAGILFFVVYLNCVQLAARQRMFFSLSAGDRKKIIEAWQKSSVSIMRDVMKFFLNLTLISLYESDMMLGSMGVDRIAYTKMQCFYNSGTYIDE